MKRIARRTAILFLTLWLAPPALWAAGTPADQPGLTFFGWSDQHIQTDGDASHLIPAIDAMNRLPGEPFPERIGGRVGRPAFVIGCGDITEWPTVAAKNAYNELVTKRLKFPSYDVVGNHDEGGKVPSETVKRWIVARHGALSYTFDQGGVHFIVLFSKYDENLGSPAQPVTREALDFLRKELAKVPKGTPVVVALHLCFDAITNKPELIEAFGDANVILVLGGHYHKAKVDRMGRFHFLQLPSPAPGSPNEVTVVRITSDRLIAIPYDYEANRWSEARGKVLDVSIQGPNRKERKKAAPGRSEQ
jgi:hypothetical protein